MGKVSKHNVKFNATIHFVAPSGGLRIFHLKLDCNVVKIFFC